MFSTDNVPMSREFRGPLPAGFYHAKLISLDLRGNQAGNGNHFAFVLHILKPDNRAGDVVKYHVTYRHRTRKSQEIGQAMLGDLMYALNITGFDSVEDFGKKAIGKVLIIETGLEEAPDGRFLPLVLGTWCITGAHRDNKRAKTKLKLGPTGRAIKPMKPRIGRTGLSDGEEFGNDAHFGAHGKYIPSGR